MSELGDVRWSWESRDNNTRVGYVGVKGRISIAELIARMQEIAPGVGLDDIDVNFATVKWTRPANAEELAERQAWDDRQRERQEKWERETLARLTAKYGSGEVAPLHGRYVGEPDPPPSMHRVVEFDVTDDGPIERVTFVDAPEECGEPDPSGGAPDG